MMINWTGSPIWAVTNGPRRGFSRGFLAKNRKAQRFQCEWRMRPDELVRLEPYRLPAVGAAEAIVLATERNRFPVGSNETAVRDGDPMGVTGEISQHLLWP